MKRTFEALPASSGAKRAKSDENAEKKTPESTEAQLEPVILPEIVNIKTEDAQSIDGHLLLSKPELNLELVKEEYVIQENTPEIAQNQAQNPNEAKKIDVPLASYSLNGIQVFFLKNKNEIRRKDYPELVPEKRFRRLTIDDKIVKMLICGEKISTKISYKAKKVGSVLIECPLCPEIVNKFEFFIRHVFNHHRFYVCLACNLTLDINTFQNHLREIHETRPLLECDACDFSVTNRLKWTFHLQEHLEKALDKMRRRVLLPQNGEFSCPLCLYSKRRKDSYLTHLKLEHRFFECVACYYNAESDKDLKQHMNVVHRNGDTFDCNKCRFSAANISTYNHHFTSGDHVRGATESGDFSCTKCYYNANSVYQATFHLQNVHSIFCCFFCDEFETNNELMLKRHINEKHYVPHKRKLVKCSICPFRGKKPGINHVETSKDHHKEAKKTTLNSILAQGFSVMISRKSTPIENDSVKQEIGEEEPIGEDALINGDDIKVEIDFCEIKNE